ncbi:hypothetical protein [Acuticoccus sediminis]|uniref:hypothetical protein n=1 Tax=Acuticoccus sediminis TaxID=2184697 RepID=UPI001CFC9781|nr:hypothetical protein [Acuticoccus sediminis]
MSANRNSLRTILLVDAGTCGVMGAFLLAARQAVAGATGLPPDLVVYAGLALLPTAAVMALVAMETLPLRTGTGLVVAGNALWIAGSLAVVALLPLTIVGVAFVLAQSMAVAVLMAMEAALAMRSAPLGAQS